MNLILKMLDLANKAEKYKYMKYSFLDKLKQKSLNSSSGYKSNRIQNKIESRVPGER